MKLIPFPFSLNIGTDIVHIPRIHRLITRRVTGINPSSSNTYLCKFSRRILCDKEQAHFHSRFPSSSPLSSSSSSSSSSSQSHNTADIARWLAGRFAAKEAARKAAPGGAASVSWKDVMVQIENGGNGRPEVVYLKDGGAVGEIGKLSISHDGEYVVATVMAATSNG